MLRLLLLAVLAVAAPVAVSAAPPADHGWLKDLATARARAESERKQILVDLWADWCGWCKRLEKDVFSTPVFQDFAKGYVLLRVDTEDGGEGTRLMEDFEVESLPTTLLLTHDLVKVGGLQGYLPPDPYVQSLRLEAAIYGTLVRAFDEHRRAGGAAKAAGAGAGNGGESAAAGSIQTLADELHARRDGARAAELYQELIDRGGDNPEENAWNRYYYADSLRLDRDFAAARRAAAIARKAATKVSNEEMVERIDLLFYYVARDANACAEARQAIDSFVAQHPTGVLLELARREQDRSKSAEGCPP